MNCELCFVFLLFFLLYRHAFIIRGEKQKSTDVPVLQSWEANEEVLCHRHDLQSRPLGQGSGDAARILVRCSTGEVRLF